MYRPLLALPVLLLAITSVHDHYNMLLPDKPSAKKGEEVTFTYQWGHPFEHQLFDAPKPAGVYVLAPDGKKSDLAAKLEEVKVQTLDKKEVRAYRFRFKPEIRGDFVFVLKTPPIWMEEEQEFFQDTVKAVLHVQAQKGWDAVAEVPFQLTPLTRPYGLQPGMVFQAEVEQRPEPRHSGDRPAFLVEIEHYNREPPQPVPPDEQITRTAKTDPSAVVTCTLTDPGWLCLTAQRDRGKRIHEGQLYPVRQRATFWVFVEEKIMPGLCK